MQLRNFYIVATIQQTKHNICHYSKISPLALTHLRSLSMKDSTLDHTCSCGIFSHSRIKACLRSARLRYFLQLTLSSNIDHIEKSSGFKSGDLVMRVAILPVRYTLENLLCTILVWLLPCELNLAGIPTSPF